MHIFQEVWKLLFKTNNKEKFWDGIKAIKHEIYKACGFRAAKSLYNVII